ncbi:retrovirus-related Pol polyprotein from transposon 412 [Trichonephila clavipes]|nr:retrovirus-related Pol polyprotein from transposon 412 [Trichonephila clavipes]
MPVQLGRGQRYVAEGSCIATMLEHPSNVSLSISWDLCQGLHLVISTYLLSLTTSRNGPKCTPFGSGSPHRSGGCSAALDIEIWGTSSTSFRSGKKFRLCGIEGGSVNYSELTRPRPHLCTHSQMAWWRGFNRTILNNLSLMVSKNQQDWGQKVPLFLLAYRSAVHETTGYSPSQMLFGRDLRLPL